MRKQECSPPSNFPSKHNTQRTPSSLSTNSPQSSFFPTKYQFVEWLKALSTEERYLAVQVKSPKVISIIRNSYKRFEEEKQTDFQKPTTDHHQKGKIFLKQAKTLIEGLVFMSGQYYLDTLGFDFNMVECPEKIYDLLSFFKEEKNKKVEETGKQKKVKAYNFEGSANKEEWVIELVKFLKKNLTRSYGMTWNPQILDDEKNRKREFSFFWKYLNHQEKLSILYLGCCDIKELMLKLIDMDIPLNPTLLETEIQDLLKLDKNQFCNKLFKCKLKKSASKLYSYYGLVYNQWKECVEKSRKKKFKKSNKKKNIRRERNKSLGGYSNETNETEYKEEKFDINIQDLAMNKLEQDILDCSDWISDTANEFFERRVLAFERIQSLLHLYEIPVKLYGSCASGIAIKNSDVDIAIDDKILSYYHHLPSIRNQLEGALQFLSELFSQIPWITNIKLIHKAKVPLIKLTIDTDIPANETFFSEEFKKSLNRPIHKGGKVCADLTIETKNEDDSTNHLGIISTMTINSWLEEIPTLRSVILILKYHLTRRQLNQTYANGLNTYCLIVMVVAFLDFSKLREEKSVAIVMSRLLSFYGWQFDEKTHKIDLLSKDVIVTKTEKNENVAALEINDPLCNGRIMTRNCYRFDEIKEMMRDISKKCINRAINQVEELCSKWDPKEKFMTSDQLYEIVVGKLKDNHFISQLR